MAPRGPSDFDERLPMSAHPSPSDDESVGDDGTSRLDAGELYHAHDSDGDTIHSDGSEDQAEDEEEGGGPPGSPAATPLDEESETTGAAGSSESAQSASVDEEEGEEGDGESDDDDEEGEEEEEEPVLKYALLGSGASDILAKDSATAIASSSRFLALGTQNGMVHVLSYTGQKLSSYRASTASIMDIRISDDGSEYIGTASFDGKVVINSLVTPERYIHDFRRPLRTLALEPNFSKRSTKSFVCGGMAGNLSMMEKGWRSGLGGLGGLGNVMGMGGGEKHKETILHEGEGPIWKVEWSRGGLIAWANDLGVKIYDTHSQKLVSFIDRPQGSPRADLFKPILTFLEPSSLSDPTTLIIAWADHIKLARIRTRSSSSSSRPSSIHHHSSGSTTSLPTPSHGQTLYCEITAIFQVDCMISGLTPYKNDFLVLAYVPPDEGDGFATEITTSREEQKRKAANRPELRIISRKGEELSSDALSLTGYHLHGCNDYILVPGGATADPPSTRRALSDQQQQQQARKKDGEGLFIVVSPKDIVVARERDARDRVAWLVERERYEEALDAVELLKEEGTSLAGAVGPAEDGLSIREIGEKFLDSLMAAGDFDKAASLCSKVLGHDKKAWEDWIFLFAQRQQIQSIIPYTPTSSPQLSEMVYEMILAHFLASDRPALLRLIETWPPEIYNLSSVINAIEGAQAEAPRDRVLMDCLAELYLHNHQPEKALPYFLRLRRMGVFNLIRDFNLFTSVRDQALLLVEFDMELSASPSLGSPAANEGVGDAVPVVPGAGVSKSRHERAMSPVTKLGIVDMARRETGTGKHGKAIQLLVDHSHSIPIGRVVSQLEVQPKYLFMYLDSLFEKDAHLVSAYGNQHIALCAEFDYPRLADLLRSSTDYSLEKAFQICKEKDFVPEMVFLLGRMGNNREALMLIIQRLDDVERAIEFAKDQNDAELWEDLLRYSENKPAFIRGLLENVGSGIDPVLLIRRIKNGLEIPGLKEALIKILQDFNLQISLLEDCQKILHTDCSAFSRELQRAQTHGFSGSLSTPCSICSEPVFRGSALPAPAQPVALLYLCRKHVLHATCALPTGVDLPGREDGFRSSLSSLEGGGSSAGDGDRGGQAMRALGQQRERGARSVAFKISYAATLRDKIETCPPCRA